MGTFGRYLLERGVVSPAQLEEATQVCLEYLAKAVESERFECQKVAESHNSADEREIAAELRGRAEAELDVPD